MAAGINVAVTKKRLKKSDLAQDNCIFLGAVRLTRKGPVFGVKYRWE